MTQYKRMFVEGEWNDAHESTHAAMQRLMRELDDEAARNGVVVTGDVAVAVSEKSVFAVPRTMRLEADVVTR
jgi:phosphodiesterase/alkaline phosphatase D-like protein